MRTLMMSVICSATLLAGCAKEASTEEEKPAPPASAPADATSALPTGGTIQLAAFKDKEMEVGCGKCVYEMAGVEGCRPAVLVDGTPLLVTGAGQDKHICGGAAKAMVSGSVQDGTLLATSLDLKE